MKTCPARTVKHLTELSDVLHHLLVHVILHLTECGPGLWYSSRAANLSHSSLAAGFRGSHCEKCVVRIELVRLELVGDHSFPDGHGAFWVTSLAILACCRSAPAATAVLNSWTSVSCLKISLFPVHHLGVQRLVHTFLILTLLLLFDCSILLNCGRNCGCLFRASLQRALCVRISTQ